MQAISKPSPPRPWAFAFSASVERLILGLDSPTSGQVTVSATRR